MKKAIICIALVVCFVGILVVAGIIDNQGSNNVPHTHFYWGWETIKEASCTEDGSRKRTCHCGHEDVEIIYGGHNWTTATCESAAVCTICGVEGEAKLGHSTLMGLCTRCNQQQNTIRVSGDKDLRYAVVTDIHWNDDDSEHTGLSGDEKTQLFINAVNAEHAKKPFDFLLITGDVNDGGGVTALKEFMEKYMPQFDMPVILFPGNHDGITNDVWYETTGYQRQMSFETDDFYFIYYDTFSEHLGKTWLSHWSAYYESGNEQAYITCESTDDGALLIGEDILASEVTPIMRGWSFTPTNGEYVKLAYAKDADMYKSPSLDYVKEEVKKAGDKYIVFISHQILSTEDGDEEEVKAYLGEIDNFLFYLE